ncbi:hypothetical protein HDU76_012529 [Blyttiomyces sp. JEL0837]|nr:hypothetical protein HDU76_012529 [Blyttiomyces sp. JEL0837]
MAKTRTNSLKSRKSVQQHFLFLVLAFACLFGAASAQLFGPQLQQNTESKDKGSNGAVSGLQSIFGNGNGAQMHENAVQFSVKVAETRPRFNLEFTSNKLYSNDIVPDPAGDVATNNTVTQQTDAAIHLNIYTGIGAGILIITGFFLVFFGHRIFKPVLFVAGFYLFAVLTFVLLQIIESKTGHNFSNNRDLIYFITCIVIVGGILIYFLEKPILVFGTAIPGSYAVIVGADFFIHSGFADATHAFLIGSSDFSVTWKTGLMLGAFAILALVGIVYQFKHDGRHKGNKEREALWEKSREKGGW